ncbi:MAG: Npt1/Npt2 family nucleotide transporter, partial [Thermodesulfobacteriota bacterium]
MKTLKKWMNLSDTEAGLFVWSALLIFLIRCAGLLFNNFAETAFLKRFGVEFLPVIYILNPVVTLVVLAKLTNIMDRVSGYRILGWCLVFCGLSASAFRALIPLGSDIIYPVLFVMKVQFETILGILFWNLANDLFNLRLSKRLFPLITAGGVVGDICGSVFTPVLAQAVSINNLVLVYGFISICAAVVVFRMRNAFPAVLVSGRKGKEKKKKETLLQQFSGMRRLMKSSTLVTVLVLLTFFANVVLPVMNYQFNFAVDAYFATETQMLGFFGYFRAVMNAVSLGLLFYSSRFYGKFGLPVALMFHPANYMFVFLAFLFRFDVFTAMYARFSTSVFRTVFNKPVNNILIGIFPESYRSQVRPFLRGAVARAALIAGSLL